MPNPVTPADELAASEMNKTITAISEVARRARGERPALPHPYETDANLAAHLSIATAAATGGRQGGWRGRLERQVRNRVLPSQQSFDAALIDIIHQLDHRDRQQREEIADLHQQLAELRSRIDATHLG